MNRADFVHQCIALEIVNRRHIQRLYCSASTFSQLEAFHEASLGIEGSSGHRLEAEDYFHPVWKLAEERAGLPFTWPEVKSSLKNTGVFSVWLTPNAAIPEEKLDEALSCLLNDLVRNYTRQEVRYALSRDGVELCMRFLTRGARFFFGVPDEEISSIATLLTLAKRYPFELPILDYSSHICCALSRDELRVIFDNRRLAPLSCMVARKIPTLDKDLRLFRKVGAFVEFHQELRTLLVDRAETDPWMRGFLALGRDHTSSGNGSSECHFL